MADGHFAAGSMLLKIKAALDFIEHGGDTAIITSPHLLRKAMQGKAGTRICREGA
jgi:carbamate kinase